MSAGFILAHLEACAPSYKQASQLCFTAGFTKEQQDTHHLQVTLFFPSACLKLYIISCNLLCWLHHAFSFHSPSKSPAKFMVEPELRRHLLSGAGLETRWEAHEGFAMGAENPSPPWESGDNLRVKGDIAGSVWTQVLLISVTLAFI